jgi:topoisomerase-4 subunit B
MAFEQGEPVAPLEVLEGKVAKRATGTTVRFWPEAKYFDSPKFALKALKHNLKAKAVLAAGLKLSISIKSMMKKSNGSLKMVWSTI